MKVVIFELSLAYGGDLVVRCCDQLLSVRSREGVHRIGTSIVQIFTTPTSHRAVPIVANASVNGLGIHIWNRTVNSQRAEPRIITSKPHKMVLTSLLMVFVICRKKVR